jgi:hypothetical protein
MVAVSPLPRAAASNFSLLSRTVSPEEEFAAVRAELADDPLIQARAQRSAAANAPFDASLLPPEVRSLMGILPSHASVEDYRQLLEEKYGRCADSADADHSFRSDADQWVRACRSERSDAGVF